MLYWAIDQGRTYMAIGRHLSISRKFLVSLCGLLIIPLVLIFFLIHQYVSISIQQRNIQINQEILAQTKLPVHYLLQDIEFVSLEIIGNQSLQYYMQNGNSLLQRESEQLKVDITYELGKLVQSRDAIRSVSIFTEEGTLFQFGGYLTQEPGYPYIKEVAVRRGRPYWVPAYDNNSYFSVLDRGVEISLVRAINSIQIFDQILGYQRISIPENYITSLYKGSSSEYTKDFFIIDSLGNIISTLHENRYPSEVLMNNLLHQNLSSEGVLFDENHVIYYYAFDEVDWYMVKVDSLDSVQGMGVIHIVIGLSLLVSVLFGITFYFVQRHYIIQPVTRLQKDMVKVKDGQYHIDLHTKAQDEIGELNQGVINMSQRIQSLIEREYKMKIQETEAQLQYLQSQINPHFLYNTLETLRWMAVKEQQHILAKQITALSNHFRHSLNQGKKMTTLREEVQHLQDYLTIQKNRFTQLHAEIQMDTALGELPVLNLILQPLVENSIVHGLEEKLGDWNIYVSICRERRSVEGYDEPQEVLFFTVEDNGVGVDQESVRKALLGVSTTNNALALNNVNKRLKYKYGEHYGIRFFSTQGEGTRVEVIIPIDGSCIEGGYAEEEESL